MFRPFFLFYFDDIVWFVLVRCKKNAVLSTSIFKNKEYILQLKQHTSDCWNITRKKSIFGHRTFAWVWFWPSNSKTRNLWPSNFTNRVGLAITAVLPIFSPVLTATLDPAAMSPWWVGWGPHVNTLFSLIFLSLAASTASPRLDTERAHGLEGDTLAEHNVGGPRHCERGCCWERGEQEEKRERGQNRTRTKVPCLKIDFFHITVIVSCLALCLSP